MKRIRNLLVRLVAGAAVGALAGLAVAQTAAPATAASGAHATDSAVTVSGRGEFKDMKFTVSQTKHLTSQAITVSWTGGAPTALAGTLFNTDFVQIMQCWGDDDGTVPANPGPSRTQCQYGASPTTDRGNWPGNEYDDTRKIFYSADPTNYGQDDRYGAGGVSGQGEVPFKSVDGTLITSGTQNNALYSRNTTNEVDFARTGAGGKGQEFFEVQTANEAPHLGCGVRSRRAAVRPRAPAGWSSSRRATSTSTASRTPTPARSTPAPRSPPPTGRTASPSNSTSTRSAPTAPSAPTNAPPPAVNSPQTP